MSTSKTVYSRLARTQNTPADAGSNPSIGTNQTPSWSLVSFFSPVLLFTPLVPPGPWLLLALSFLLALVLPPGVKLRFLYLDLPVAEGAASVAAGVDSRPASVEAATLVVAAFVPSLTASGSRCFGNLLGFLSITQLAVGLTFPGFLHPAGGASPKSSCGWPRNFRVSSVRPRPLKSGFPARR
ncbi:unnamed protein product [Ectocarpus sp. 12 AP-2014]